MYYELATGGHGIWPAVYSAPFVYDWLFAHSTAVPEPSSLAPLLLAAITLFSTLASRRKDTRQ
jgi:hypothetical protein